MKKQPGDPQSKFLSSLLLLIVALTVTFVVLFAYSPNSQRGRRSNNLADDTQTAQKARPVSKELVKNRPSGSSSSSSSSSYRDSSSSQHREDAGNVNSDEQVNQAVADHAQGNKEIETKLTEAMNLVDSGDPQSAMTLLKEILTQDPKNEMALVELGMIYLIDLKEPHNAKEYLERALDVNPNNKVILSELGGIYEETDPEAGLAFLENQAAKNPDSGAVAGALSNLLVARDRPYDAIPYAEKAAEKAMEEGSSDTSQRTDLADLYSQTGQGEKAADLYKGVAESVEEKIKSGFFDGDPGLANETRQTAWMDYAGELQKQGRNQEAKEIIDTKVKRGNISTGDFGSGSHGDYASLLEGGPKSPTSAK